VSVGSGVSRLNPEGSEYSVKRMLKIFRTHSGLPQGQEKSLLNNDKLVVQERGNTFSGEPLRSEKRVPVRSTGELKFFKRKT